MMFQYVAVEEKWNMLDVWWIGGLYMLVENLKNKLKHVAPRVTKSTRGATNLENPKAGPICLHFGNHLLP